MVITVGSLKRLGQRAMGALGLSLGRVDLWGNLYILPALAYSITITCYYLLTGVILNYLPALLFLAAVCAMAFYSRKRRMGKYWISIISIMVSYETLQGVVGTVAIERGIASLYPLDRLIWGFNVTGWVQSTFASPTMTTIASILYTLHVPLVAVTCIAVWYFRRSLFGKYVTVMVITSYAALLTFLLVPTAPPWYAGVATNLYQSAAPSILPQGVAQLFAFAEVDKFAAFPSLHGAYAIIFSYFMIKMDKRLAWVSIPVTAGILFSTVYLGQHYLIDLIGGAAYALVPCLIAERFQLNFGTKESKPGGPMKVPASPITNQARVADERGMKGVLEGRVTGRRVPKTPASLMDDRIALEPSTDWRVSLVRTRPV